MKRHYSKEVDKLKFFKDKQIGLNIIFIILCALMIYPLLMVIAVSLTKESDVVLHGYKLIPKEITFTAYEYVFKNPERVINAYKVTAIFSFLGMFLSVLLMAMIAYPLSNRRFKLRKQLNFFLYFTMLFNGGLVPTYILITKYLQLADTIWVYILPGLISPWYVFMMRTFFSDIPEEMLEAVKIDGGNQFISFFGFVIPLSKPVLATVALFIFLTRWNDWNTSMLYINNPDLYSLQFLLQDIMQNISLLQNNETASMMLSMEEIPSETVRMAMAMIVAGPALLIFPFFQKYFTKGLTVGSVKG